MYVKMMVVFLGRQRGYRPLGATSWSWTDCKLGTCEGGHCGEAKVLRLTLYPQNVGPGWQGSVNAQCQLCMTRNVGWISTKKRGQEEKVEECKKLTKSQWANRCKHRCAERRQIAGHYKKMSVRCRAWGGAVQDIEADPALEGRSLAKKRERLKQAAKVHAEILCKAMLDDMTEEEQGYVEEGMEIMLEDIDKYSRGVG